MKVKSKETVKELVEKTKVYTIGMDGCICDFFRRDTMTVRMFLPLVINGIIKGWHTNNANPSIISVYTPFRYYSDGNTEVVQPKSEDIVIAGVYKVENGIDIDLAIPGEIMGGQMIIKNLLTIEID